MSNSGRQLTYFYSSVEELPKAGRINFITSSNQRLGECVRSKMDSQSVAKEHDRRHTMLFNMPQME